MIMESASGYWQVFIGGSLIGQATTAAAAARILRAWEHSHSATRRFLDR